MSALIHQLQLSDIFCLGIAFWIIDPDFSHRPGKVYPLILKIGTQLKL